jgi:hypothetical protein
VVQNTVEEHDAPVFKALMLVSTYQNTRCHMPKYHNLNVALLHLLIWNEAAKGYRDKKQGIEILNHSCVRDPVLSCAAIQPSPVQITNQITHYVLVGHCRSESEQKIEVT